MRRPARKSRAKVCRSERLACLPGSLSKSPKGRPVRQEFSPSMRARLTLEAGESLPQSLDLSPGQPITLGRGRDNTFVLRDELASRLHAKVYFEDGRWYLRDFGLNGTRVDGQRVNGAVELTDGKKIKI